MEEQCGDLPSFDTIESNLAALKQKLEDDFAQMESVYLKAKALNEDWIETQQCLKVEEERKEKRMLEEDLNAWVEEMRAALEAELSGALTQIKGKEEAAAKLRREVAALEQKVEAACKEVAQSAARLEEEAHSASLAVEASLRGLFPGVSQKLQGTEHPEEGNGEGPPEGPPEGPQGPPLQEEEEEAAAAAGRGNIPGPQEHPLQEEDSEST